MIPNEKHMNKYLKDTVNLLKNPWGAVMTVSLTLAFVGLLYELFVHPSGERNQSIYHLWNFPLGRVTVTLLFLAIVVKVVMGGLIVINYQPPDLWFRSMGTIVAVAFLSSMCLIGTRMRFRWGVSPSPGIYAVLVLTLYAITITFIPDYAAMVQDTVFTSGS
jgi:hypothetical protein